MSNLEEIAELISGAYTEGAIDQRMYADKKDYERWRDSDARNESLHKLKEILES